MYKGRVRFEVATMLCRRDEVREADGISSDEKRLRMAHFLGADASPLAVSLSGHYFLSGFGSIV